MKKLLRVERSVGGVLCVGHYYLSKKRVCGVSLAAFLSRSFSGGKGNDVIER